MEEHYQTAQGELKIEYRHSDGTKASNQNGFPLIDASKIKDNRILDEIVDMSNLEPFLIVR